MPAPLAPFDAGLEPVADPFFMSDMVLGLEKTEPSKPEKSVSRELRASCPPVPVLPVMAQYHEEAAYVKYRVGRVASRLLIGSGALAASVCRDLM